MPSLVALVSVLPGRAKDISAPPLTYTSRFTERPQQYTAYRTCAIVLKLANTGSRQHAPRNKAPRRHNTHTHTNICQLLYKCQLLFSGFQRCSTASGLPCSMCVSHALCSLGREVNLLVCIRWWLWQPRKHTGIYCDCIIIFLSVLSAKCWSCQRSGG